LLFCFIAFSGGSRRWEFKNVTKNVLQGSCVKGLLLLQLTNKSTTKIQNRFPLDFFNALLKKKWAFLGEGDLKTRRKNIGGGLTSPGTFLASEEPTIHFCFEGPVLQRLGFRCFAWPSCCAASCFIACSCSTKSEGVGVGCTCAHTAAPSPEPALSALPTANVSVALALARLALAQASQAWRLVLLVALLVSLCLHPLLHQKQRH
jgi:hypothetical protein